MGANVDRAALIRRASLIALLGNLVLAAAKISVGLIADSFAVIGDGVDTSVDVLIAVVQLFIAGIATRPADAEHPWGHGRAETIGTAGISFLLFFAGFQLIAHSAGELFSNTERAAPQNIAIVITLISIAGKLLLALNQYQLGKKSNSKLLIANAKNMTADIVISAGVLAGLLCSKLFKIGSIDSIAAILIGVWVMRTAINIFIGVNAELMDGGALKEQYKSVFEAVHSVQGAGNPHRTRIRQIAGYLDIDIDIEVDGQLSLQAAHSIATQVENAIRVRLENIFDIMIHVEPAGDSSSMGNEAYGLSEKNVEEDNETGRS
ncbi:MAG: cation diffusion facilitator family transporter [Spirochaetaceae bacterium]|jgi:cation diffusion facilitator family transporter|nr:cation diffusion facilitator family transporter [Spirochaetaceae bacterium]